MIIHTTTTTYTFLKDCLSDKFPAIPVYLVNSDEALQSLGFSEEIPCTIEIIASNYQIEEILEYALELERDVYMNETPESDAKYFEYLRWERIYNLLS